MQILEVFFTNSIDKMIGGIAIKRLAPRVAIKQWRTAAQAQVDFKL